MFEKLAGERPAPHCFLNIVVKNVKCLDTNITNFFSMNIEYDNSGITGQSRQLVKLITNIWVITKTFSRGYSSGRSFGIAKQ